MRLSSLAAAEVAEVLGDGRNEREREGKRKSGGDVTDEQFAEQFFFLKRDPVTQIPMGGRSPYG